MIGHLAACLVELNRVGDDTSGVDWERTRKYGVHALAQSGTPLFVSCQPGVPGNAELQELRESLARSSVQQDGMQPLDWMENSCPVRWLVNGQEQRFS